MSVFQALYTLFFSPLELLFEIVYGVSLIIVQNAGAAIFPLSLCINFLLLPLYNRADLIQKEEREREKRLSVGVEHIKKAFRGDERQMVLQTYYRLNNYKPLYMLRSSLPLILEIPFFVAAYNFLSNLGDLTGASFGPLADLAAPDNLLHIGGLSISVLPILMTAINIVSSYIYAKDLSRKDKLQLYGMAFIFLVLLYNSPSGLVLYWTLNNIFSLVKNIVNAAKNPRRVFGAITGVLGCLFFACGILVPGLGIVKKLIIFTLGLAFMLPAVLMLAGKERATREKPLAAEEKKRASVFMLGCLFLTLVTGLLIPSSVIVTSPAEFVLLTDYQSPLYHILGSFLLAAGTFMVWFNLFYYLADRKARSFMDAGIWIISILAMINYLFFATDLGNMSATMQYEVYPIFTRKEYLLNTLVMLLAAAALLVLWLKKDSFVRSLFPVLIIGVTILSVYNVVGIQSSLPQIKMLAEQQNREKASFELSKNGKNVVVFMLDRGISGYIPYLFQENPELAEQFSGFTWYPNTLSYGTRTNTASPALFGGYEYTPEEINKRDALLLEEKQNEALKLMPLLFSQAGYDVTLCDPPYAGYTWVPDLSVFDGYEGIRAYNTESGQFVDESETWAMKQGILKRNLFCYSIMKVSPLVLQLRFYQEGWYFSAQRANFLLYENQSTSGTSQSSGIWSDFTKSYSALCALPEMTRISDGGQNTFLMMSNSTTHNAIMLREPEYVPEIYVDNTAYDMENSARFTFEGRTLLTDSAYKMKHYHSNMAALMKLGEWFDYMRENGVYDNTRIIIVADHGWPLEQFSDMKFGERDPEKTVYNPEDAMAYNPLLLVKDFDSEIFTVDNSFMTNADTPTLAFDSLIEAPRNPFTGETITSEAKQAEEHHVFYTDEWGTGNNNGNTFLPGTWYALKGQNIFDMSAWRKLGDY